MGIRMCRLGFGVSRPRSHISSPGPGVLKLLNSNVAPVPSFKVAVGADRTT